MKRITLSLLLSLLPFLAKGQKHMTWDEFVDYVTQEEEQTETEEWIQHLEDLEQLALHPININTATREELQLILFLSDYQIDDILNYVARYQGMKTLYELRLLRSLGNFELQALPLFIYAGQSDEAPDRKLSVKEMFQQSHHELVTRVDIPLYHRRGYLVENGYRGSRIYNKVKYRFTASNHLAASFHTEKDQGEKGIDSYGGQVMLKDFGHVSTLIAGDYKVGFGEGLVMNQGFHMGKSTLLARSSQGVRAYTGTDEVNFLRGAATTLRFGKLNVSAFASYRSMDATLNEEGDVKSIVKTGYHRTVTEFQKKDNFHETMVGSNVAWKNRHWHLGATGYYLHTDKALSPGDEQQKAIYPHGKDFGVVGTDYGYEAYRWQVKGETAYSTEQGGLATLNTLSWRLSSRYQLTASQRYYSRHYYSFFASALSDNSNVQNETAATLRVDATPFDGMQLTAYADFFHNPWPRYGLETSTTGQEFVIIPQYSFNRRNQLSIRYSYKNKESYQGVPKHHRLRAQWTCKPNDNWKLQTTAMLHEAEGKWGEAIGETVRYGQGEDLPLQFAISGIYFHTDNFDSRVYLYEPNVTNTLSIPSFYGHGVRFAGTIQYAFLREHVRLELKYGVTRYFDRDTQSDGLQTIYSRFKNDISLQCRIRV